jgi:hypothetical protein
MDASKRYHEAWKRKLVHYPAGCCGYECAVDFASGRAFWHGPHGSREPYAQTFSHGGKHMNQDHASWFDMGLGPQATYLSPRQSFP